MFFAYIDAGRAAKEASTGRLAAAWVATKQAANAARATAQATRGGHFHINRGQRPHVSGSMPGLRRVEQAALLRDIFGPLPFRPVTVHPHVLAWNDRLVVRLAQAIYDERRWGDMPILADALLEAGCDEDEVLAYCRAGGEHVRGCWVIDLLLGKE